MNCLVDDSRMWANRDDMRVRSLQNSEIIPLTGTLKHTHTANRTNATIQASGVYLYNACNDCLKIYD